ncbi:MAG: ParA family protein [Hyphomicrobiales bacterium]|nr:ParA family protein [Hyphomicrobiales bacterium]
MRVILVANSKGGCGKTTLATTLATALAGWGAKVGLADADRQKSTLKWLKSRPGEERAIQSFDWSKERKLSGIPKGLDWLVVDAPGALRGPDAEDLVAEARHVIVPLLPSIYDITATERFLKRIERIKKVKKGKADIMLVPNRVRPRSRAADDLSSHLKQAGRNVSAQLSDRSAYANLAAGGLGIFDRQSASLRPVRMQWNPILKHIAPSA